MSRVIYGVTVGTTSSPESIRKKIGFEPETYATEEWVEDGYQPKGNYLTEHQDISGKLDANKLPEAVNDALAQAKASGEFDGEDGYTPQKNVDYFDGQPGNDGVSATHSWNGTVLSITSASGTSSADLQGKPGDPGKTPVKGEDYWTAEDKAGIVQEVAEQSGAFYVTITGDDNVGYTADKTVAEITEAYEAGKLVYCNTPAIIDGVTVNALLPFVSGIEGILLFSCWINGMSCNAIYSTEGIEVITCDVATYIDIPMAMPNPQHIEFNGAVTGRYNGSEKVTITIPTVPTVADILAALPTWNGGSY